MEPPGAARDGVRGIARLGSDLVPGRLPVAEVGEQLGRTRRAGARGSLPVQLTLFAVLSALSTLAYAVLYLALRGSMAAFSANVLALVVTAIGNTAANRRLTFGIRDRSSAVRHQVQGLLVFAAGVDVTTGSLWLLRHIASGTVGRMSEVAVLTSANLLVTVARFAAMRRWILARSGSMDHRHPAVRPLVTHWSNRH